MQAGPAQTYLLPITNGQQGSAASQSFLIDINGQRNAVPFPSTEHSMAPINNSSTPQQRPPLQNHGHSRSSSFFSFRNKASAAAAAQNTGHLRTSSLGSGSAPEPPTKNSTQQGMATQGPQVHDSMIKSNQPQSQAQAQPQPQPTTVPQPLHPEIRSVVQLTTAHAHKIYYSGPLVRRIERRTADGQRHDEVWFDIWAQLGGTTLSIWDMAQVQEASKQGKEVPPNYVNTTDAFVQVIGGVTVPQTPNSPARKYSNVFSLNTAGSNVLLFSSPDAFALKSWVSALRLSAWEKSRLEEIYTAHLLRIMIKSKNDNFLLCCEVNWSLDPSTPSTLVRGRLDGWVRIRIAGQTDWKRMWMVINAGAETGAEHGRPSSAGVGGVPTPNASLLKKNRVSNLFSRDNTQTLPPNPTIMMYASQKAKDKKKPLLTFKDVTQAFAVYPERPELISRSTLIKLEGTFGDEETAAGMKTREGWLLIMPELEPNLGQADEMLKWVIALHDAFNIYGRPDTYTWDPRNPSSLMFAYPVGPSKDLLFLARELAETLDPREESTSSIRSRLIGILHDRMRGITAPAAPRPTSDTPPTLPPIDDTPLQSPSPNLSNSQPAAKSNGGSFQLPPLTFGGPIPEEEKPLSPVRRQSTAENGISQQVSVQAPPTQSNYLGQSYSSSAQEETVFNRGITTSPTATTSPPLQSVSAVGSPSTQVSVIGSGSKQPSLDTHSVNRGPSGVDPTAQIHLSPSPPTMSPNPGPPIVTVPKRTVSVLTSPHSIFDQDDDEPSHLQRDVNDRLSILTSPHSIAGAAELTSPYSPINTIKSLDGQNSVDLLPTPRFETSSTPTKLEDTNNLLSEAGALYYMHQSEIHAPQRHMPTTIEEQDDSNSDEEDEDDEEDDEEPPQKAAPQQPARPGAISPASNDSFHGRKTPVRQSTPMAFFEGSSSVPTQSVNMQGAITTDHSSPSRQILGRKPSGARAQATTRPYNAADSISSQHVTEESPSEEHYTATVQTQAAMEVPSPSHEADLDALAVLSYLAVEDKPASPKQASPTSVEPLHIQKTPSPTPAGNDSATQFKSSFAPSKQATERKAKAQAQQVAHQLAVQRPGRANGKRQSQAAGAWNESSEEEDDDDNGDDDDDDDDDDDADSDADPSIPNKESSVASSTSLPQRQNPTESQQIYAHLRPPRSLPQVPGNGYQEDYNLSQRNQYSAPIPPRMLQDGIQIRSQAEFPQPGAARQNVWSQVLDPNRGVNVEPQRNNDTFVQLEPSAAMTKAFTPQGLLSAGIQDKQDRSAKRQEELARETGASLINVPNKPPPPQMGLLGAITAHERERKREGGVGAALTEREREKRVAEDRQRRFDEHQRQQLDQMQQGGSMYGYPAYGGMNPMMMMNPMMGMNPMGGMNPMMAGGGMAPMMTGQMGYPGMMAGFNPQHFFAAQQAAQAYQQAMMAFSVAGSQIGGDNTGGAQPLNPAMTGGNMTGNMSSNIPGNMGFDPRTSMMGMPMMGQMPMAPMNMQMTGMSTFDARFPPNMNDPGLAPPVAIGGQDVGSRNSSPGRRSSPLARQTDSGGPSPRAESPKS
ncbi:hypothetical protein H0H93_000155 [Arthromyces matolae]|nr:hypothetical protein H0H93_000155 [Arthromyces matolae]